MDPMVWRAKPTTTEKQLQKMVEEYEVRRKKKEDMEEGH